MTTLGTPTTRRTPTGLRVAPTSYAKIEAAANQLRPMLPVVAQRPFSLDAWRILEQTLPRANFQYRIETVSALRNCAAFAVPERNLVVVREDVYDGLFEGSVFSSSTIVHELSHIALGHHITLNRGSPSGQHRFYEDSEWQANSMTAALMMPLAACRLGRTPERVAELCGVSVAAASYRIERLKREGKM